MRAIYLHTYGMTCQCWIVPGTQSIRSGWSSTKEKAIINLLTSSGCSLLSFKRWYTKKQLEKGRNVNKWLQYEVTLLDIKQLCFAKFYFIFLHDTLLSPHNSLTKLLLTSVLIAKWIVSLDYFLTWNTSAVDFTEYFEEKNYRWQVYCLKIHLLV